MAATTSTQRADLQSWSAGLAENRDPYKELEDFFVASGGFSIKYAYFTFLWGGRILCKRILNI